MKFLQKLSTLQLVVVTLALSTVLGFGLVYGMSVRSNNLADNNNSCKEICIALEDTGANPSTLSVPVGSFVQFNSADGKSHSLSLGGGGEHHSHSGHFSSGTFKADEAWRVQFKDEGTFKFHDHFNPKTNVLLVVYTPGKDYKIK